MSIPTNIRTPILAFDVKAAPTPYNSKNRLLLIGHKIESGVDVGTATIDEPVICTKGNIDKLFGKNSMLASMARTAIKNKPLQEIWALPVVAVG
ncbi:MAG: hypothetical protein HRU28_18285, partial [Rhizobiales bacterium]|nr:hypothetical protein [Hyphomicrobiales bacterium]